MKNEILYLYNIIIIIILLQWQHIAGKLKWISSGNDLVFGVNSNDDIFYRAGISSSKPAGTNWVKVPGKLSQIDSNGDEVWGANSAMNAFSLDIKRPYGIFLVDVVIYGY